VNFQALRAPRASVPFALLAIVGAALPLVGACTKKPVVPPRMDAGMADARSPFIDGSFVCQSVTDEACDGTFYRSCVQDGEFLAQRGVDCSLDGRVCVPGLWCVVCRPGQVGCFEGNAAVCRDDGSGWDVTEECDIAAGFACQDGMCQNLCEVATRTRSYQGCEFFAVDLDNASLGAGRDASAQPYAVVVSNAGIAATEVVITQNDAAPGEALRVTEVDRQTVLPGDLEVFMLPRREVDGRTARGLEAGTNEGAHSALTSNAYRVTSTLPIVAYQFNPLDNVGVFSNDASLLIPTSGVDRRYTVIGWPQTIADSSNPDTNFDPSSTDEDLRAFLTIVGTQEATTVTVDLGVQAIQVVGLTPGTFLGETDTVNVTLGPFDVLNLETQAFNADFTGTIVDADKPVVVYVGSEASDAPRFGTLATRQCCADHLEEQLVPDSTLGSDFIIARSPRRTTALNAAFLNPLADSVAEVNEPEWVRVVAVSDTTLLRTTLPPPNDVVTLYPREDVILRADQDFQLTTDRPVAVLQTLSSQEATGIPNYYPGGDPSIIVVPPIAQWRRDYVLLTPDKYAFDFLTIMAPAAARILLDGAPLPPECTSSPGDGIERRPGDPPPTYVVYRCQFSYPDVIGLPNVRVEDGEQDDGVHTLLSDLPVGVIVTGFDDFVSYAYAAGMNLDRIN
jgi:hypothetical protein